MVGRAILWLVLGVGIIVAALSLGFVVYMLVAAALDALLAVSLRLGVLRAAWDHPASVVELLLFITVALALLWWLVPSVAGTLRRARRTKAAGAEAVVDESPAGG